MGIIKKKIYSRYKAVWILCLFIGLFVLSFGSHLRLGQTSALTPAESAQNLRWVYAGGPVGGLGYDIRMHPFNPDILFVTDAWAGVFKSVNGGRTWRPSNKGITTRLGPSGDTIPVFCLTFDPNNPSIVWAGTQYSSGIFRSDDSGDTWKLMNDGIQEKQISFRGITIQTGNSDVVYIAGELSSWEWNNGVTLPGKGLDLTKGVVYKTENRGISWKKIWEGDNLARYIWIHPQNPKLIYVSTGIFDREAANSDPENDEPGGVGILRSRNGGKTWEILNEKNGLNPRELFFGSLYMHPYNPQILIAASGLDPYSSNGGVYLTEDGGDTWVEVIDAKNMSSVEFAEADPNIVYAGSLSGFFRSWDGGHTWQKLAGMNWGPEDVVAGFPIDFQVDPRNPLRIFVNNYGGGNFLSEDGGESWKLASAGYTGALMNQIAVASDNPDLVYATARSGVFRSDDGGKTWSGTAYGPARALEAVAIAIDPRNSDHILATIIDAGHEPLESNDGGRSWRICPTKLWKEKIFQTGSLYTKLLFNPENPHFIYSTLSHRNYTQAGIDPKYSGFGIVYSQNSGKTWKKSSLRRGNVLGFAAAPSDPRLLYAAVFSGGFYLSEDYGKKYQLINRDPLANLEFPEPEQEESQAALRGIISLAVDPENTKHLYAGLQPGGVIISLDGGKTWEISSAGMPPEGTVRSIVVDPVNSSILYAALHEHGVYRSTNYGEVWESVNRGLLSRVAQDLAVAADGSVLYLASLGGGVFRLNLR